MKPQTLQKTALALLVGWYAANAAAYSEQGQAGNTKSWESAEYLKDWGLTSMNASTAYALGFNGSGVKIGVMDSGVLLNHPEFQDGRIHVVKTEGTYSKDGMRYPDASVGNGPINKNEPVKNGKRNFDKTDNGIFTKSEAFNIDGAWHKYTNDAHGTHVGGTMAASRDGNEMHGVAFGANLYSANTGGNDNMTYGPNQDYDFFLQGYSALADVGAKVINNSWGSNRRVNSSFAGALGYKPKYDWRNVPEYGVQYYDVPKAPEPISSPAAHIYLSNLGEAEKAYYQFVTSGEKNFVDAAYEVAKNRKVIQVFTAGNRSMMAESFTRAMLPYFRPDAEKYWVNVTGQVGGEGYPNDSNDDVSDEKAGADIQEFNLAGHSKWWTIAAPSANIYSSYIQLQDNNTYGDPIYKSAGGTSMAAPHVSGALGVIFSRYPYMTTDQARYVMLTTARQTTLRKGLEGKPLERWETEQGVPSNVWGWGILDLGKAMFGPGQFLGNMKINLNQNDVWSNDISDKAIKARQVEDQAEAATWTTRKAELQALMQNRAGATAEEKAEYQVGLAREVARNERAAQGYVGTLTKNGSGTLTLTGNNSFTGAITVNEGQLSGLNQSLGSAQQVIVKQGATLEVLPKAEVTKPSENGFVTETLTSTAKTVTATVEKGSRLLLNNGIANVNATFADGSILVPNKFDEEILPQLQKDPQKAVSVQGTGSFVGAENAVVETPRTYDFFAVKNESNANTLKVTVQKKALSSAATTENEVAIANALDAATNSAAYQSLIWGTKENARQTFARLSYDEDLAAQQHNVLNGLLLRQQLAQPSAVRAQLNAGTQIWTSGTFTHFSTDSLSSHAYNQLVGIDATIDTNKHLGVFVGSTQNSHKIDRTSKDRAVHLGLTAEHRFNVLTPKIGFIQSWGKHEQRAEFAQGVKTHSQTQNVFAELAYTGLKGEHFAIEPYAGVSYMHIKNKGVTKDEVQLKDNNRDLIVTSVGLRPSIPFAIGGVQLNLLGDVAYHRFHKDKAAEGSLVINNQGVANLYGKELKNVVTTGVALQAQFTPAFSVKVGYQGAYNHDTKANNVNAELRFSF
ncbi:S8 family serine peptidase [Haemophilus parainfluenzae]|uniref:Autotransporter domain-containing protein n=1 Tax=Haemophilus parainfluenzae TaxID=729 RepID=A0AAQ0GZS1_HAEPA|nr:S8 family serine peptidase [Haemophilus parainfluenzae]MBS5163547.1 S8 family serine peptidase [Haemophilus parainfluenzae]RDE83998.1 autotransporter domain-containing protein [Haemophilus parainfluenzae]